MPVAETVRDVFLVDAAGSERWLEKLLESWSQGIDEYARRSEGQRWTNKRKANRGKGDAAYWYSERVDVGFFAANATKLGLMALLELPHIKRRRKMALSETKRHRIDLTTFDQDDMMSIWEFKRRTIPVNKEMSARTTVKAIRLGLREAAAILKRRSTARKFNAGLECL